MRSYIVTTEANITNVKAVNVKDAAEQATGTTYSGPSALSVSYPEASSVAHVLMSDGQTVKVN